MNRENLIIGKCYWIAAPNLYDNTTYEVDKFELLSFKAFVTGGSRGLGVFTRPKNWKANKEMSGMRRGYEIQLDSIYVFETKKEAFESAAEHNWMLSRRAARVAIKYGG